LERGQKRPFWALLIFDEFIQNKRFNKVLVFLDKFLKFAIIEVVGVEKRGFGSYEGGELPRFYYRKGNVFVKGI
jgi:hypothetical protein